MNGTNAKTDSGQTIFNATTFPNVWGSGNTMTTSTKYNIRLCCGSSGRICTDNCIIEHNNGGNENWDIPTIGLLAN